MANHRKEKVVLEKNDRNTLKNVLTKFGCKYLKTNFSGPFTGKTGRPDIEGIALDGIFFTVELKRRDRQLWNDCTEKQKKELETIQKAGGRACVLQYDDFYGRYSVDVPIDGRRLTRQLTQLEFAELILTGQGWPKWNSQ